MSKVLQQQTQFLDMDILRQALESEGFRPIYSEGYPLRQFQGYAGQTFEAALGMTKTHFQEVTKQFTYGDLGFHRKEDGTIGLIGDDILIAGEAFKPIMEGIQRAYGSRKYIDTMQTAGFAISSQSYNEQGDLVLQFQEMA